MARMRQDGGAWLLALLACVLADVMADPAHAGGQQDLHINATVLSRHNCRFVSNTAAVMSFGAFDPSGSVDRTASTTVQIRCNGGPTNVSFSVGSDDGQHETGPGAPRMRHASVLTEFLPYFLDLPKSGSVPRNTNQNFTVNGTIRVADFQNALAGSYSDAVVMTITP